MRQPHCSEWLYPTSANLRSRLNRSAVDLHNVMAGLKQCPSEIDGQLTGTYKNNLHLSDLFRIC
jgi:hypothetical protein